MTALVRWADRLGIERLLLSQGYSAQLHPTPDQFREENDRVMRAVRHFLDRSYGSVYLSPAYPEFSVQEFDRCVRDGPMVSVGEIEADKPCSVPEMDLIVERAELTSRTPPRNSSSAENRMAFLGQVAWQASFQ